MSIYIEIGYLKEENVDIEYAKEETLANLRKIGIITDHRLVHYESILMSPAYVHISQESNLLKERLFKFLKKK